MQKMYNKIKYLRVLEANPAAKYVPPQAPVSGETEKRVLKRGGLVVFEKEVSHPREGVALDQRDQNQPPNLRQGCSDQQYGGDAGADKVQSARDAIGVLAQVERVELNEAAVGFEFAHGFLPACVQSVEVYFDLTLIAQVMLLQPNAPI
jgi:hypothetical protein